MSTYGSHLSFVIVFLSFEHLGIVIVGVIYNCAIIFGFVYTRSDSRIKVENEEGASLQRNPDIPHIGKDCY